MRNNFDHLHFNAYLKSKTGKKYFMGINSKSEAKDMAEQQRTGKKPTQEDDYILPLAKKHYEKLQMNATKYWERKA